jgi:hypothetical protein
LVLSMRFNHCLFDHQYQPAFIIIDVTVIEVKHNDTGSNMMGK